jgi:hypothetical protein
MPFTISGHSSAGGISFPRETAIEAIKKAVEMMGDGVQDVYITDVESGRIYRYDEFALLLKAK